MSKPAFCICENKGADQLAVTAQLTRTIVFAIKIVQSTSQVCNFKFSTSFVAVQHGFCLDLVGKPDDRFLMTLLILFSTL